MDDVRRPKPLRVNLRGRLAADRQPRISWHPAWIAGGAALAVLAGIGLDRVSPGAGAVLFMVLRWLVALGWVVGLVMFWRLRDEGRLPVRWLVLIALAAVWFLARASIETHAALT
jgi:hypothetical protein